MRPRLAIVSSALPDASLAQLVSAAASCDVDALELTIGADGLVPIAPGGAARRAAQLRELRQTRVTVCGVAATPSAPLGDPELARVLEVGVELAAPFLRVFAPPFDRARAIDAQLGVAAIALASLDREAAGAIAILLEPAQGTIAASPELARRLIEHAASPSIGVVFDPGSLVAEGHLEPALALSVLDGLIAHVHVKNRVLVRGNGRWRVAPRALGSGRVDWPDTLRRLVDGGYTGWLSIDHLSHATEASALGADVAALRRMLAAARAPEQRRQHADAL